MKSCVNVARTTMRRVFSVILSCDQVLKFGIF